jgi:hypothetical protein
MPTQNREVAPGPRAGTVLGADGQLLVIPAGWELLPPGDPGLTRRVKSDGPCWTIQTRRGRKVFSLGVLAPSERIARFRAELAVERADPRYANKLAQSRSRRAAAQERYEEDFGGAVLAFLGFAPTHAEIARELAEAITRHAVPVGSGTVARTTRIPVAERAEAATIAWLRHATTGYDDMQIPRIKGMRRDVRRQLAARSRALLERYRRGEAIRPDACILRRGLTRART